jgi:hypothetical protein
MLSAAWACGKEKSIKTARSHNLRKCRANTPRIAQELAQEFE